MFVVTTKVLPCILVMCCVSSYENDMTTFSGAEGVSQVRKCLIYGWRIPPLYCWFIPHTSLMKLIVHFFWVVTFSTGCLTSLHGTFLSLLRQFLKNLFRRPRWIRSSISLCKMLQYLVWSWLTRWYRHNDPISIVASFLRGIGAIYPAGSFSYPWGTPRFISVRGV